MRDRPSIPGIGAGRIAVVIVAALLVLSGSFAGVSSATVAEPATQPGTTATETADRLSLPAAGADSLRANVDGATHPTAPSHVGTGVGSDPALNDSEFQRELVVDGLTQATAITFLPDGQLLVLERGGTIYVADAGTDLDKEVFMELDEDDVATEGEEGLIDITLDPAFAENGYFYLYYSHTDGKNRISRFEYEANDGGLDSSADPDSEEVIWKDPNDRLSSFHQGGGIDFGPDGKLYLSRGDNSEGTTAQDLAVSKGKIIRINPDGSTPDDNPFVDDSDALDSVWAYGLRNPYRAQWDLGGPTPRYFIAEVGGNDDSSAWEDLYLGEAGANYGWPDCEGVCEDDDYTDPIYTYPHVGEGSYTEGASLTGGFVYRGNQFPHEYQGAYFYADFVRGWIKYLTFEDPTTVSEEHTFMAPPENNKNEEFAWIIDLEQGPDGSLYYVDMVDPWEFAPVGEIYRISYDGTVNDPPRIEPVPDQELEVGDEITIEVEAMDPEADDITLTAVSLPDFAEFEDDGDGTGTLSLAPDVDDAGEYTASIVADDGDLSNSTDVSITVTDPDNQGNQPPVPTITTPSNGSTFRAGDTITFSGTATDPEDGTLDGEDLEWTAVFVHDEHAHPYFGPIPGSSGSTPVETVGHDFRSGMYYQLTLTANDSDGATNSTSVSVYPDLIDVSLDTEPSGLEVSLDGVARPTPIDRTAIIDQQYDLSAPEFQCDGDTRYVFQGWADGSDRERDITIPDEAIDFTATYEEAGDCLDETDIGLTPESSEVGPGETTTVDVVVGNAQSGIGSLDATVSVADPDVTSIDDVTVHGEPDTLETDVAADGGSATVVASGMDTGDTGAVTVATVTLTGADAGSTDVELDDVTIETEDGQAYPLAATTAASLDVAPPGPVGDFTTPPTDPDGDGRYEDINGDGTADVVDVQALFANLNDPTVNGWAFDFNGDGTVDVVDVQALFVEVIEE